MRQGGAAILQHIAFVIIWRKGDFLFLLSEDLMTVTGDDTPFRSGLLSFEEAILIVFMPHTPLTCACDAFGCSLLLAVIEHAIHLRAKTYKLFDGFASALILHFPQDFLVHCGVQEVVGRVVAGVEQICIFLHVFVDVFCFHIIAQAVSICEEQPADRILLLHVVIMELVHERFAQIKDGESHLNWLVA